MPAEGLDIQGFGESSAEELMELRKALEIGTSDPPTGIGFDALRVESLDASLKLVTYSETNIVLWNAISKMDAFSTVEEFNRLLSYGQERGGFVASGELPPEEDSVYERDTRKVKFCGTTRSVHHPATLVRTLPADLIAQETQNGILWMLRKMERSLFYGDEGSLPLEWDSLTKQVTDGGGTVIDLRGGTLSTEVIENGADAIMQNFGNPSMMFSNPKVFTDFAKIHFDFQRFASPGVPSGMVGVPVTGVNTQVGPIMFRPDVFVTNFAGGPGAAGTAGGVSPSGAPGFSLPSSPLAPNPPTIAVAVNGGPIAGSLFGAGDAGDYGYQVTAVNRFGESAASALNSSNTVAAGDSVTITITDGGGANPATAYKIYRTDKDDDTGTANFIGVLTPRAKDIAGLFLAVTAATDLNADLPKTYLSLMLDMTMQSLTFKQLSPLVRMPLATISPAIRWMQLLYGTPIVFAPKKNVVYKNIGEAAL